MALKYDKKELKFKARKLRVNMTDAERKLWQNLRCRQISGLQFYRQRPLGKYIVDFYCPKRGLAIEIDGSQHYEDKALKDDKQRTECLKKSFDLKILRFTNIEVLKNFEGVLMKILEELK